MQSQTPQGGSLSPLYNHRGNNFDALRLFLATMVILSHSYALGIGSEQREPFSLLTNGQLSSGSAGVYLFFVISGFLITNSFLNSGSLFSFFKKRIYRIYPAFIVCMLICYLIAILMAKDASIYFGPQRLKDFLFSTLRLRDFYHRDLFLSNPYPGTINGSVWSISYEFGCYIGVAMLGTLGLLRRRYFILGLFILAISAHLYFLLMGTKPAIVFHGQKISWFNWARLSAPYLAGVVFLLFRDRIPLNWRWASVAVLALVVGCHLPHSMAILFPTCAAYLTFYVAFHPGIRLHNFAKNGDFSYGVYLYGFPIQQTIMYFVGHKVNPWFLFAMAVPQSIILGFLSWHLVEKWFLRRARAIRVGETLDRLTAGAPAVRTPNEIQAIPVQEAGERTF